VPSREVKSSPAQWAGFSKKGTRRTTDALSAAKPAVNMIAVQAAVTKIVETTAPVAVRVSSVGAAECPLDGNAWACL
jgi:hypothetical protein